MNLGLVGATSTHTLLVSPSSLWTTKVCQKPCCVLEGLSEGFVKSRIKQNSIDKPSKPRTDSKIVQKSNTPKPETSSPHLQPASEIATSGYLSHSILQSSRDYNHHPQNHSCTMADPPSKTKPRKARAGIYQSIHNPGYQNFDLSDGDFFDSDGNASLWPTAKTRISDAEFLKLLSQAYNARSDLVKQWSKLCLHLPLGVSANILVCRWTDHRL